MLSPLARRDSHLLRHSHFDLAIAVAGSAHCTSTRRHHHAPLAILHSHPARNKRGCTILSPHLLVLKAAMVLRLQKFSELCVPCLTQLCLAERCQLNCRLAENDCCEKCMQQVEFVVP